MNRRMSEFGKIDVLMILLLFMILPKAIIAPVTRYSLPVTFSTVASIIK